MFQLENIFNNKQHSDGIGVVLFSTQQLAVKEALKLDLSFDEGWRVVYYFGQVSKAIW